MTYPSICLVEYGMDGDEPYEVEYTFVQNVIHTQDDVSGIVKNQILLDTPSE